MPVEDSETERRRRRGGVALPWRWGSEATSGWGPGALARNFLRALMTAPEAVLPRVLAGLTLVAGGSWLAATAIGRWNAPDGAPLASPYEPAPAVSLSAFDARPPVDAFVRGMSGLWGPVLGMGEAGRDSLNEGAAPPPPPPDGAGEKSKGSADAADNKEPDPGAGAGDGSAGAGASGGDGSAGAGGNRFLPSGGAGAGAALLGGTSSGNGAASGAAAWDAAMAQARAGAATPMRDLRAGVLRSGRPSSARGGKGALRQLRFADGQSRLGVTAAGPERSYDAAKAAFEGAGTGAGSPIGGAGASEGGAGLSASPSRGGLTGPLNPDGPRLTCPSGYSLDGRSCRPLQGTNKTPYQKQADMAKAMILIAALLAAIGILLATRPVPWMQIVGGMLLGAAASLIVAALAIGADIESQHGQTPQRKAIDAQAARAAP